MDRDTPENASPDTAPSEPVEASLLTTDRQSRRAERRRRLSERRFDTTVPSPCIAVCQMDSSNRRCIGCKRDLDEIRDWMIMTAEEKRSVLDRIRNEAG